MRGLPQTYERGEGRTAYIHRVGTVESRNQPKSDGGVGVLGLSTRVYSSTRQKPKSDRGVGLCLHQTA
jgi:hypothetical protein